MTVTMAELVQRVTAEAVGQDVGLTHGVGADLVLGEHGPAGIGRPGWERRWG